MTELPEELLQIADRLDRLAERGNEPDIKDPLEALNAAVKQVARSFSGSWLGYHAHVYYAELAPPPPGARFSQEWGLQEAWPIHETRGDWREYDGEAVKAVIRELSGHADLSAARHFDQQAKQDFETCKSDVLSVLQTALTDSSDAFLTRLRDEVNSLSPLSPDEIARRLSPKGQVMTRDTVVFGQGTRIPPHVSVLSEVLAIQHTLDEVRNLAKLARQAGSHLSRLGRQQRRAETIGTNVFIGHGRSLIWRELKDFIEDRLRLPVDEFNRVPVAGVTNIARLSEMLDAAAIAFLIMTGEDEQQTGKLHARLNVVHEAGLFQGRLGFTRAIILLEDGCEEFSNIAGLGQIRFPKGNIKAAFEEIRQVIEREGLLNGA